MKKTNFEFTEENTLIGQSIPSSSMNCMERTNEFSKKYGNGVKPLFPSMMSDIEERKNCIKGKVIDKIFEDGDDNTIICFTDNSFVIKYHFKRDKYATNHLETIFSTDSYRFISTIPSSLVLYDGDTLSFDWSTMSYNKNIVMMTEFGKWLHEHTDADVVGYYEEIKKMRETLEQKTKERKEKEEKEREMKQLEEFKNKYSLTESWINCSERMPEETKQDSDTLQGHREWVESEKVLVCTTNNKYFIDWTRNGVWVSNGTKNIDGFIEEVIAWMPIPKYTEY